MNPAARSQQSATSASALLGGEAESWHGVGEGCFIVLYVLSLLTALVLPLRSGDAEGRRGALTARRIYYCAYYNNVLYSRKRGFAYHQLPTNAVVATVAASLQRPQRRYIRWNVSLRGLKSNAIGSCRSSSGTAKHSWVESLHWKEGSWVELVQWGTTAVL